jgi:hypothetical protein
LRCRRDGLHRNDSLAPVNGDDDDDEDVEDEDENGMNREPRRRIDECPSAEGRPQY